MSRAIENRLRDAIALVKSCMAHAKRYMGSDWSRPQTGMSRPTCVISNRLGNHALSIVLGTAILAA